MATVSTHPTPPEVVFAFHVPHVGWENDNNYAVVRLPFGLEIWECSTDGTPLREATDLPELIASTSLAYHSLQAALAMVEQERLERTKR